METKDKITVHLESDGSIPIRYIPTQNGYNDEIRDIAGIKYQPIMDYHFVCQMPMIDAYLVKDVYVPKLKVNEDKKLVSSEPISIALYEAITPSTKQLIMEAIKVLPDLPEAERTLYVRQLDNVGVVISQTHFTNVRISSVAMLSGLSYQNSACSIIQIEVSFDEAIIDF